MTLSPLEKAASGALASAFANALIYPLDLSKTIIQTQVQKHDPSVPPRSLSMSSVPMTSALMRRLSMRSLRLKSLSMSSVPTSGGEDEISSTSTGEDSVWVERKPQLKYKNTLDVLRQIYAKKGVLGWYNGLISSIVGSAAQSFSYFYWYSLVRATYASFTKKSTTHKHSTAIELFLGALAAAISQIFTLPIGVITTQQQTDKELRSLYQLAKEIYAHDGIRGFWKGLKVSLVLCMNPSITYGSYERLKQILFDGKQFLGPLESFTLGMCAKSLATLATQPLIVSKAMLQKKHSKTLENKILDDANKQDNQEEIIFANFLDALGHLWQTEKFLGLYKGVAPQLLKGVIVQGMLFMFKDQIDMVFVHILKAFRKRRKLKLV